ncbi:glycosyltransferase family 2 protein [candidate division KSB1 bacterium]|nr:glycosyltransferase family 2 protein [candidate division KSB1 bacterium]
MQPPIQDEKSLKHLFSIIIVNWNTRELTLNCIQSIYQIEHSSDTIEIILIDNASSDGSVAAIKNKFKDVQLIENKENVGFAKACNQGIKTASGDIILLINSDILLKTNDTFKKINDLFDANPEIGIVSGKLFFPDGTLQTAGNKFITVWGLVKTQLLFSTAPIIKKIHQLLFPQKSRRYHFSDYVAGAFLAILRRVIDKIGLLNENYFMYGEDMEWCARARQAGWKVAVHNEIEAIHFHAQSSKKNYEKMLFHNTKNNCQIIRYYHGKFQAKLAFFIYLKGMFLRIFIAFFRNRQQVAEYWHGLLNCWKNRKEILED